MDRKKRLEKGIESLEEREKEHKEKIKEHIESGGKNRDLIEYWEKEREGFRKEVKKKKSQLNRKKK